MQIEFVGPGRSWANAAGGWCIWTRKQTREIQTLNNFLCTHWGFFSLVVNIVAHFPRTKKNPSMIIAVVVWLKCKKKERKDCELSKQRKKKHRRDTTRREWRKKHKNLVKKKKLVEPRKRKKWNRKNGYWEPKKQKRAMDKHKQISFRVWEYMYFVGLKNSSFQNSGVS